MLRRSEKPLSIQARAAPSTHFEAFEACPNRKITPFLDTEVRDLICPKYPTGVEVSRTSTKKQREAVAGTLGCLGCSYSRSPVRESNKSNTLDQLHKTIVEECGELYSKGHYPEATIKGFMTVRERLRDLTGYEKATEAFGKGGLCILGAAAEHVDDDFQRGVQFLLMSIDMFRNEGVHSNFGNASGQPEAYEYLSLSSLAMNLLDNAIVPGQASEI